MMKRRMLSMREEDQNHEDDDDQEEDDDEGNDDVDEDDENTPLRDGRDVLKMCKQSNLLMDECAFARGTDLRPEGRCNVEGSHSATLASPPSALGVVDAWR